MQNRRTAMQNRSLGAMLAGAAEAQELDLSDEALNKPMKKLDEYE